MSVFDYKCWGCGAFFHLSQDETVPEAEIVCPECVSTDTTRVPSDVAEVGGGCADLGDYGGFT